MSIIHYLVRLDVIVTVVSNHDHFLRAALGLDAVPDNSKYVVQPPVQSVEMFVLQDRVDGVSLQGTLEGGGEARPSLEGQQHLQGGGPDEAALIEWSQDGDLIMPRLPEGPSMVQVYGEGVIPE